MTHTHARTYPNNIKYNFPLNTFNIVNVLEYPIVYNYQLNTVLKKYLLLGAVFSNKEFKAGRAVSGQVSPQVTLAAFWKGSSYSFLEDPVLF